VMDLSVLFLAVPSLSDDLHPSSTELLWITDVYGFLIAGALIVMGTLGDRIGRRRVLVGGSAAFGLSSVLAALSTSPEMLVVARGLQGIAGATLIPSTMALLFAMFPHEVDRMKAMGLISLGFTGGAALGPIIGGVLLDAFSWHAVFLINVPAMLAVLALVPRLVPEFSNPAAPRVDAPSAALLMLAVLPATYGVKQLARGDGGTLPVLLVAAGLAVGAVFLGRQGRIPNPLLNRRLFRNRVFSVALSANTLTTFVMFGTFFFVSQYLQLVLGLSPLASALWSLPGIVAMSVGTMLVVPKLAQSYRPGPLMAGGAAIMAIGLGVFGLMGTDTPPAVVAMVLAVFQFGVAPLVVLGNNLIIGSAPPEASGAAAGTSQTFNELGGALGIALLGSLGTAVYRGQVVTDGLAGRDSSAVHDTLAGATSVGARIPHTVLAGAQHAFTSGMTVVTALAAVVMLAVAVGIARWLGGVGAPEVEPSEERVAELVPA
jgi:MFS transporter, DHA2 family, multidrug resistance protein